MINEWKNDTTVKGLNATWTDTHNRPAHKDIKLSVLLALCEGNALIPDRFRHWAPVMRRFDIFVVLSMTKPLTNKIASSKRKLGCASAMHLF